MRALTALLLAFTFYPGEVAAQSKIDPKPAQPRIIVALPLAVRADATTKITLRGVNLDRAAEASVVPEGIKAKLLDKGKSAPPDQKLLDKLGDTQATFEITIPPDLKDDGFTIAIKTADIESKPQRVLIDRQPLQPEKEPNDGFRESQPITLPLILDGAIKSKQDVDVFRFEAASGQRVHFEIGAARHGSPIEPLLTLYDAAGNQVAAGVRCADSVDCVLETTLPRAGSYSLVLQDAHDLGSAMHVYRLSGK